jgi:hypothetical protein
LHAKFLECNLNLNGRSNSTKKKKEAQERKNLNPSKLVKGMSLGTMLFY